MLRRSVVVVGGGIIGLSIALKLADAGHRTTVLDAAPGARAASWAAGGMLAPHHERLNHGDLTDPVLWRMGAESLALWPDLAERLGGHAEVDLQLAGGLVPECASHDVRQLAAAGAGLRAAGVAIEWLSAADLRQRAPAIRGAGGGWWLPGGQVDPRRVLGKLQEACVAADIALHYGVSATAIEQDGVRLTDGTLHPADEVVLASGAWSPELARLSGLDLVGEPVKGQMLRFEVADGLLPSFVHAAQAYLIPRTGCGLVVGATMVESGFDRSEDPLAIAALAAAARALIPALAKAPIAESWTGLRPRLQGGLPRIRRERPGLITATGHFRNGILLAPLTARMVGDLVGQVCSPEVRRSGSPVVSENTNR